MLQRRAFSLVELSIVLVILGLLVGGVLAGKNLIRASELRTVSSDFARYKTASYSFRDKYFRWPGDLAIATSFWTADAGCSAVSTTTTTCNGNGNGLVDNGETSRYWQHMAFAGLIEGSYNGVESTSPTAGTNMPKARISGGYFIWPLDESAAYMQLGTSPAETQFFVLGTSGTNSGTGNGCTGCGGVLKHEEAWNIDTKMDDGTADKGRLRADLYDVSANSLSGTCSTYTLTDTTNRCVLGYLGMK